MIIATLAPFIIAFLVIRFNRIVKRLNKKYLTNQRIVEKRIEIYERIGPKLHDIISFYCYSGNWKEITPLEIRRLKKELDEEININSPLFSNDLGKKYNDFMLLCFVSFSGWEHKEKIKSLYEIRQEQNVEWKDEWIQFFDTKNVIEGIRVKESYNELLACFKKEFSQ